MDPTIAQLVLVGSAAGLYAYAARRDLRARVRQLAEQLHARPTMLSSQQLHHEPQQPAQWVQNGKVTAAAWLNLLNEQPDRYPHTLIIGATGTGKTTFTRALLGTRPGLLVVLTPKPDPSDWPAVPIITIGDDGGFAELTTTFEQLDREVKRRLVASKRGLPVGDPLTIVCDDWPVLASECGKPATDLFKLVGRLGRSLRVRLVVLSQSERVKSLGLDGEGDAVDNFAKVLLGRSHRATMQTASYDLPLDTALVPQLASRTIDPLRWWHGTVVEHVSRAPDDLLDCNGATLVATPIVAIAMPQTTLSNSVAQTTKTAENDLEGLDPAVAQRIRSIDWTTVAQLVEAKEIGETAALKALGFPASSTSAKYQAARARLQAMLKKG